MWKLAPVFFLLSSCVLGPNNFHSSHSTDLPERNIRRIAILPAEGTVAGEKGKSAESAPNTNLSNFLFSSMSALPDWQIVSDREVKEVGPDMGSGNEAVRARKLAELVYADAVVSSRVVRYRERVGGDFGVKSPASVAFVLDVRDARRGDVVWSARFDETQRPPTENIFGIGEFAQRGARWLSAEELMREGVKKSVQQLHKVLYGS
jgi:hypothetical protein